MRPYLLQKICNIIFQKWGEGGSKAVWNFPKIHPIWRSHPSLICTLSVYPFLEKGEKISYEKFNQSFQKQLRKYGNAHCFNSVFPTWVTESPVFFLIVLSYPQSWMSLLLSLRQRLPLYHSEVKPKWDWKKAVNFHCKRISLSENVYKFPFEKNSSRLVIIFIIIVIVTTLTWLLSRSLILSLSYHYYYHYQHYHYYYSHLVIILLTCPFNCAVASRLKGNENMKKMKKKSPWKKR